MENSHLFGNNPKSVINLIKSRKLNPNDSPERKLGLIIEGGGMRGVLSAGALLAVDLMGFREAFDKIYATSAGSVNAAFFLSGQGKVGISVYFDHISNKNFINPLRITKIVDVDFVYDYIIRDIVKLDEVEIKKSETDFILSLTEVNKGNNVLISIHDTNESIPKLLKASSAIPVLYNKFVDIDGNKYVDGGLTCKIPIFQALNAGCTDLLVILTKPINNKSEPPNLFNRMIFYTMMGYKYPSLMMAFNNSYKSMNKDRMAALGQTNIKGLNVATICPDKSQMIVKRTTLNRDLLLRGAKSLALVTTSIFKGDEKLISTTFNNLSDSITD